MSEFDKHWDTHCISSNCEEDEAKIHFEAGQQSQQAKIDELKMSNHHLSVQLVDSNAHYDHVKKERDELQAKIDDLTELNRLRTIALEQSVNRTSIHVHEKIIALENKLKGNKDEN